MKIDPLTITIDEEEVTFGTIGFRVYVDATLQIRQAKEKAFSRVVAHITQDPLSAATTASSAIDGYMAGMIVSDFEVRQWLFSPEGEYFLFGYSLKRANPDAEESKIEDLFDSMSLENKQSLQEFFVSCITKTLPEPPKTEDPESDA